MTEQTQVVEPQTERKYVLVGILDTVVEEPIEEGMTVGDLLSRKGFAPNTRVLLDGEGEPLPASTLLEAGATYVILPTFKHGR